MNVVRPLVLLVGFVLHAVALWLLGRGHATGVALLAHGVGAVLWGLGATLFFPIEQRASWWQPASVALLFPVLGPVASVAVAVILRGAAVDRSARKYTIWREQPQGDWAQSLPAGSSGQSIVEILQSPHTQLRRNAILALRELEPQMAIPLLRKGLQDSDEQVRIYAQNILSSTLERFESGIKELEQRLSTEAASVPAAVRLAEQYYELVYLDVAGDEETSSHYLAKAQALLERAATTSPDSQIAFLGLKYALRARDLPAARRWLSQVQLGNHDARQVLPWHMEVVFLEGDWAKLRELFAVFACSQAVNPRIDEIVRFWSGEKGAAA